MTSHAAVRPDRGGRPRVVVLGSLNVDLVTRVERHPVPGETVRGDGLDQRPGGKGANQAVAAASAGGDVVMVGCVGDDTAAGQYLDLLGHVGVDAGTVRPCPGVPTGHAFITVDAAGENTIVVIPGANELVGEPELAALETNLARDDVVVLQCEIPADAVTAAVALAHRVGATCVLNLAPYYRFERDVLDLVDVLVVNQSEHEALVADHGDLDPARLVITAGADGATWADASSPAAPVPADAVVDTTGAGDAFCGALAAALADGFDPADALSRGIDAGAAAVRHAGAQHRGFG
jgi:ribokinase